MRGQLNSEKAAAVLIGFKGLIFHDKITPTDLDALLDFGNECFVLVEAKYKSAPLPYGQRLALERLTDNLMDCGKKSLLIVAEHEVSPEDKIQVDLANCIVREYRSRKRWLFPQNKITVRKIIDAFLLKNKIGGCHDETR